MLGGGGIWVGIVSEIWNHKNMVVFENGRVDLVEVFTVVQRKTWSWITVLLLRMVLGTSMLHEVSERLIFGVSYLMFVPRFESCVFCAVFLGRDGLMCLSWVAIGSCL